MSNERIFYWLPTKAPEDYTKAHAPNIPPRPTSPQRQEEDDYPLVEPEIGNGVKLPTFIEDDDGLIPDAPELDDGEPFEEGMFDPDLSDTEEPEERILMEESSGRVRYNRTRPYD